MRSAGPERDGWVNVGDLLRFAASHSAERPAVVVGEDSWTWAQLDRAVDVAATALRSRGLRPGDRVLVSLPTGRDILTAMFAVARAGLIAVPIGPNRLDLTQVVARITPAAAIAGQPDLDLPTVISPAAAARWWDGGTEEESDSGASTPIGGGEDIAVLARAASSNRPVMVSHRAILAAVRAIAAAPRLRLKSTDRAILVLPTYHLTGWVTAFLPLCVVGGAAVIPGPPTPDLPWIDAVLRTVRTSRVTVIPGAPTLYRRLRSAAGVERALASVRLMTSGAAPLRPDDFSAVRALTGQAVEDGYGISESASVVSTSLMTAAARTGSVGRPLPGIGLRIVGDDGVDLYAQPSPDQVELAHAVRSDDPAADAAAGGEVGDIQISGPTLFSGYWPDGAGGPGQDGWFTTGDLGFLDDAGELHLVDRAAETIRIAGFAVYPREVEDVLTDHPYVRDAAVLGVPGRVGPQVVAVLVPMRGTHPTVADLDEFVAGKLPDFKRPTDYQLVELLPRNETGRIDRAAVRALYRSGRPPQGADAPQPPLEPLGAERGGRLPGTAEPGRRGKEDTDDDLF